MIGRTIQEFLRLSRWESFSCLLTYYILLIWWHIYINIYNTMENKNLSTAQRASPDKERHYTENRSKLFMKIRWIVSPAILLVLLAGWITYCNSWDKKNHMNHLLQAGESLLELQMIWCLIFNTTNIVSIHHMYIKNLKN